MVMLVVKRGEEVKGETVTEGEKQDSQVR